MLSPRFSPQKIGCKWYVDCFWNFSCVSQLFVLVSGCVFMSIFVLKKLRQQTQWVLQWSWMLRGVGFTLETPKKAPSTISSTDMRMTHLLLWSCVRTQQNIKILQYESLFFSPKPISKLLVNLILFGANFCNPISSWRLVATSFSTKKSAKVQRIQLWSKLHCNSSKRSWW